MRKIELFAGVVLIGLCASAASAQRNNFFNNGVALFNPIIDTVQSGDRLVVQPTVSADRKYVTIGGEFQSSNVIAIQNFPFFGLNGQGGGPVGGAGGGGPGGNLAPAGPQIQLPIVQIINVEMNASAPVTIQKPGPGPVLRQQGMFLISPP